jgi:hypothetical protein
MDDQVTPADRHSGEHLIVASDQLDQHVADLPDLSTLAALVLALQAQQRELNLAKWINGAVAAVAIALGTVGLALAIRVDHNARELNQTQEAIAVYCAVTNLYNAEARAKFAELYPATDEIQAILDVAWPIRDCTTVGQP